MRKAPPMILLIEDDPDIAQEIGEALCQSEYIVAHRDDGQVGFADAKEKPWDLLILDLMLPGRDGMSILTGLRAAKIETPTLLLSALSAVDQRIEGLRAGADDYLVKPFILGELVARVQALLRRPARAPQARLCAGGLELDELVREGWWQGRALRLLHKEFQLLSYLVQREGEIVTRAMLLEDIWKFHFIPQTNLVDVHIGRLRHKLDEAAAPPMIESVRGVGFIFHAAG
nr:response regulator transcription factor [uncultured Acidocella sp.]